MAGVIAIVVDEITTFVWADVLPNAAVGTATYVTAEVFVCCGRWNGHFCDWLILLPMGQMEWPLVGMISRQMLWPWWQMLKP